MAIAIIFWAVEILGYVAQKLTIYVMRQIKQKVAPIMNTTKTRNGCSGVQVVENGLFGTLRLRREN